MLIYTNVVIMVILHGWGYCIYAFGKVTAKASGLLFIIACMSMQTFVVCKFCNF